MSRPRKILAIVGPTAVGKSTLVVRLARRFHGEIISADSRQVYRGLDIGSGKITKREMRGVLHHLLDVAQPQRQFSVAEYQKLARQKIEEIVSRGKLPIICGGTGLYVDAVIGNLSIPEVPPNPALRKRLEKKTAQELFRILKKLEPRRASVIDRNNPRRLIRAIEIAEDADRTRTKRRQDAEKGKKSKVQQYNALWIGLAVPRDEIKEKISIRLFARLSLRSRKAQGEMRECMIKEVQQLHQHGLSWKRMEELGLEYRYISRYLRGRMKKEEMAEKLQTEIWHYAKRQITWFKRNKEIRWFGPKETKKIEGVVSSFLKR